MTEEMTKTTLTTEELKVGHRVIDAYGTEVIIIGISNSNDHFCIETKSTADKSSATYHVCKDTQWTREIRTSLYNYLQEYNRRFPPLKQLTLAENDERIALRGRRDWWGNPMTSDCEIEHTWNLYKAETIPHYKAFYLVRWAKLKGITVEHERDPMRGFPVLTEAQVKELESLNN